MIDFLRRLLFEDLLLLLVACAVAFAVALAVHRRRFTQQSRRGIWITIGVCLGLIVMQSLVVTDREALRELVNDLVHASDAGDVAAIGARVDGAGVVFGSGESGEDCDKKSFLDAANVGLQRYQVDEAGTGGFRFEIDGDRAVVTFRVTCDLREGEGRAQRTPNYWTIGCVRRPEGWKMNAILDAKIGVEGFADGIDVIPYLKGFRSTALRAADR